MNQLFYPTVDLFTYYLKNALNLSSAEIQRQRQDFLAKLPQDVQFNNSETDTEYQELTIPIKPELKTQNPALAGYYYPVLLNDVYGLQIDCSVENLTEPQSINSLAKIKTEIEPKTDGDSLTIGQTWLVSGWLTEADQQNAEVIAQACYKSLFDEEDWQQCLYSQSNFLTGKLFELWQTQSYPSRHLVIMLFPNRAIAEKAAKFNKDWMGLFCYRHKITWAYHQSRLIKNSLVNHYRKVEENTQIIQQYQYKDKKNITSTEKLLNNIQDILNQYTTDLLNLAFQKQIIEINLINYQKRVEFIKQKAGAGNELDYLNLFANLVQDKYLEQIDKDRENMQLGIKLLEYNLNAMSSRIELEKGERERSFQALVTIIGTGIAGASLVKSEKIECKTPWICETPVIKELAVPFLLISIFAFLGWLVKTAIKKF